MLRSPLFPVIHQPTRRELLRFGGLSALGLVGSQLTSAAPPPRAKSCVFLFLFGGPSQIDLWDLKPTAPVEVRGEFTPTRTKVTGIHLCEYLPGLSGVMDKVCLLRSMTHKMNVHGPAISEVFSGREYFGPPTTDQASREDWPSLSSLVMRHGRGPGGLPASVVLPWVLQFPGQPKRIAGQTGGRMGERHNALLVQGDFAKSDYQIEGLTPIDALPFERLRERRQLLKQIDSVSENDEALERNRDNVYSMLRHRVGEVLDLRREPEPLRDLYGRTGVGQSLLLARRLVESGVPLVTVNWQDETTIDGTNTCWDTHQDNFAKLKNLLCPIFDRAFPAFIEDLHQRGLLETTLVVAVGEFGRTPRMGQFTQSSNTRKTGRDHWPHCFTALLAGGGVRGGQVYGATSNGGFVTDKPVTPADLTATILHHLGIDHAQTYVDEFQKLSNRLSVGSPVKGLG
jgi:Protein of unknown function (DUF1501)